MFTLITLTVSFMNSCLSRYWHRSQRIKANTSECVWASVSVGYISQDLTPYVAALAVCLAGERKEKMAETNGWFSLKLQHIRPRSLKENWIWPLPAQLCDLGFIRARWTFLASLLNDHPGSTAPQLKRSWGCKGEIPAAAFRKTWKKHTEL